jgi:peptidoglycan/xylan/chitin deacetylase (PgdA/CDA1 family)
MPMKIPPTLRLYRTRQNIKRAILGTITHFSTSDSVAALTFDDGPSPEFTPELLRILAKHEAHATFFMLGEAARNNPDIVRQVAQKGHTIGNHSWNHPSFVNLSVSEQIFQIRECAKVIGPDGVRLFRPPFGHQTTQSRLAAMWCRQRVVTWNVPSDDWCEDDPKAIAHRVLHGIRPGAIVLFHDRLCSVPAGNEKYMDRTPMLEAVEIILEQLKSSYRFVSIADIFRYGSPVLSNWYRE